MGPQQLLHELSTLSLTRCRSDPDVTLFESDGTNASETASVGAGRFDAHKKYLQARGMSTCGMSTSSWHELKPAITASCCGKGEHDVGVDRLHMQACIPQDLIIHRELTSGESVSREEKELSSPCAPAKLEKHRLDRIEIQHLHRAEESNIAV